MTEASPQEEKQEKHGCVRPLLIAGMLLWATLVPPVATLVIQQGLAPDPDSTMQTLSLLAAGAGLLLLPGVGIVFLTRRREAWRSVRMMVIVLAGITGYWLVGVLVMALAPMISQGEQYVHGVVLFLYAVVATWALPRWAGRSMREVGVFRFDWLTTLAALILAGLLTIPWPYTGALGDRFETLQIAIPTLLEIVPSVLLIWGVGF